LYDSLLLSDKPVYQLTYLYKEYVRCSKRDSLS
jgi:hypothetical protein